MWYPQFLPQWLAFFLPGVIVRGDEAKNTVHLTFDDGPIPEVTPWVLDLLKQFDQKATFFCVGDNVRKHPDIFARIQAEGHGVGNHTMHHLHGWHTDSQSYGEDVDEADVWIQSPLFRPPYGKMSFEQYRMVKSKYRVVMWSYLSRDYEAGFKVEPCFQEVQKNSSRGAILVFHDNIKTFENLKVILPKVLQFYAQEHIKSLPLVIPS